jgi:succinate dehydrogenase / fumarate reductase cytochrome b subunit
MPESAASRVTPLLNTLFIGTTSTTETQLEGVPAMADVNRGNRPLSPHMTVWRWQLNAITSILVRITGNAMIVAAFLLVWWLIAAASGASYFATVDGIITSFLGDLVMALSVLGLWYHALGDHRSHL